MRYGIERLLYRLSVPQYADKFMLKGAMPGSTGWLSAAQ
jgi:hypothetical protein